MSGGTPVAYVAGAMRSGTTITGQMLAESRSTILVGELRPVLDEPDRHAHCDCGQPRTTCPYWRAVDAALPAGFDAAAAGRAFGLVFLARILLARLLRRSLPREVAHARDFQRAVVAAAGDRHVIDTSKTPTGILLWQVAGVPVDVVQCWRSPRRVAAAQARPSAETGVPREPKPKSYAVWLAYNGLVAVLRPLARTYSAVRYEQLRRVPRAIAEVVWRRIGAQLPDGGGGNKFGYAESHVLAANPRRAKDGGVTISAAR